MYCLQTSRMELKPDFNKLWLDCLHFS
uniref:Uncharacterized protein n=1 Tax=Arundo donax TaxID=35708 RepID=A0A0A9C2E3_ARUDO